MSPSRSAMSCCPSAPQESTGSGARGGARVLPAAVVRFFLTGGVSFCSGVVAPAVLTANRRLRRRLTLPLAVRLVWMARRRSRALPRGHAVGDRAFFRDVRIIGKNDVEFLPSLDDHEVGQERDTGDIDDRECRVDLARPVGVYVVGALGGRER